MKFLLHTQIGAEKIALEELESKFRGKYSLDYVAFVPNKNGLIQIDWHDESNQSNFFNELNCIDDAFIILDYLNNIPEKATLQQIYPRLDIKKFEQNLDYFYKTYRPDLKREEKEIRLITRKKSLNAFLRSDLHSSIQKIFENNFRHVKIKDEPTSEQVWTTFIKNRLIVTIRLPKVHLEYLNPTIKPSLAACVAYVSGIKANDSIWIPFGKSGAIGCEIVKNFKLKKLIISDEDLTLIEEAKINFASLENYNKVKAKISFRIEDFFSSKNYSDILVAQLPFTREELVDKALVQRFFTKVSQIKGLKKLVLLYPALIESPDWLLFKNYQVRVNGIRSNLLVYQRQSERI